MIFVIAVLIGLSLGSFANNVITHFIKGAKFDLVKSRCPECDHILKWYEIIPVVSYLLLSGRCSCCKCRISFRYVLVEISGVLLSVAAVICCEDLFTAFLYFILMNLLLILSIIDFQTKRLPNKLMITLFLIVLTLVIVEGTLSLHSLLGPVIFGVLFLLLNRFFVKSKNKTAIGEGDIKLIILLSLLTGFPLAFVGLWLSAIIALITMTLVYGKEAFSGEFKFPFGPYISLGYVIIILQSENITNILLKVLW